MTSSLPDLCELLEWDSKFFGFLVARVRDISLGNAEAAQIEEWCHRYGIVCLYFLCPVEEVMSAQVAEQSGFRLVDVRVTLAAELMPMCLPMNTCTVRTAQDADVEELLRIARESHSDSRFFSDPHFSRVKAADLYEEWLQRSYQGWADKVFVALVEGRLAGYITCHCDEESSRIGLLAVGRDFQGRGVGTELVRSAQAWFSEAGRVRVTVVTQGRNVGAQRLYQKCGFVTQSLAFWFHRWFIKAEATLPEVSHYE